MFYIAETAIKIKDNSFKSYISRGVNKLDFSLSILSLIELTSLVVIRINPEFSFLYSLRSLRLLRGIRLLKVFGILKNGEELLLGVGRALKSSYLIIFLFFLVNFILSTISYNLFHLSSPEYFGSPFESLYSIFKIFTIEGWYDIPEQIAANYSVDKGWLIKIYFIMILFVGGIFGLSIVNSVFVEGMLNNHAMDKKIDQILDRLEKMEEALKKPEE
uniref:ion transporter n=1 Tax=Algoriphagus sp. TaxID=1872435 RepID=UPI004048A19E